MREQWTGIEAAYKCVIWQLCTALNLQAGMRGIQLQDGQGKHDACWVASSSTAIDPRFPCKLAYTLWVACCQAIPVQVPHSFWVITEADHIEASRGPNTHFGRSSDSSSDFIWGEWCQWRLKLPSHSQPNMTLQAGSFSDCSYIQMPCQITLIPPTSPQT